MNINTLLALAFICLSFAAFSASPCESGASKVLNEAPPAPLPEHFSITFKNLTNNAYRDDQIYIQFFGLNGPALPGRTLQAVTVKIASQGANGSIANQVAAEKNAVLPAIKLSDLKNKTLYLPQSASPQFPQNGKYYGSRIYISLGAPLTSLKVNETGTGTSQPTFADNDPSVNNIFDWIEFTYDPRNSAKGATLVTFGGNTTGVDQFAIPLWLKIYGNKGSEDGPVGIFLRDTKYSPICLSSRQHIIDGFLKAVSTPFKSLLQGTKPARILSPVKSSRFIAENSHYFDAYINEIWNFFTKTPFKFCDVYDPKVSKAPSGSCFLGGVKGNDFVFYRTSGRATGAPEDCTEASPCKIRKPSSKEIFENGGVFALPDDRRMYPKGVVDYNLLASQFVAAIARHSATNVFSSGPLAGYVDWHGKSMPLYSKVPNNEYAKYFHSIGIHHRFYGMGYDDVGAPPKDVESTDQRPVGGPLVYINKPGEELKAMVIGIQW
jgi:hypothetical protein